MTILERVRQIIKKLNITSAPVPLEEVAKLFSLKIVYYPKFPNNISGTIIHEDGLNAIGVNSNHPETRQRFTIAHELGHYIMGHDNMEVILDDTFDKPCDKEQEANTFASELLMPKDLLTKDIKNGKHDIPSLAKLYNVSEQAISIRLLNTGLINKIAI